jgi:hypothetical protein
MKKFLFYFAVVCWTLGLLIHLLSLADTDITDKVPFVWLLHLGIFIVWLPIVYYLRSNEELNRYQSQIPNNLNPFGLLKIIFPPNADMAGSNRHWMFDLRHFQFHVICDFATWCCRH